MTFKSLLFCLFLYVALAWVGAAYLYQGPDIIHYGLLWTAIGLIAVLVLVIGARIFGFWRLWRAKSAARPAAAPKASAPVHPEDEAMAALLAEANAALAKAPAFAGARTKTPLATLPLYLLIGPEGSGKTSTFLNSGIEPQLLAGQGTTPVAPTRLCNIWLAKNTIFTEIGGRAFAGDLNRWGQLLATLRGRATLPLWRRILGETEAQLDLRGVIAFCDSKEFTGAASDPQRLERYSRDWQERLRAIAEQFGAEFPVYLILSKCDKITYFTEFFRRLPEAESNQVLGCTLPLSRTQGATNEVFVEAEAKRLTESFRPLYHALARRRLAQLAHEPNPFYRPGVYEFPRELKRIRSSLVQFLTDVFRPYSLGPTALLRGYYCAGTREAEVDLNDPAARKGDSNAGFEATRLFRGDATQFFQGEETRAAAPAKGKTLGTRWLFVADLFHKVVLLDQSQRKIQPVETRVGDYRKLAVGAVGGLCLLLSLAFAISWINNRRLLSDVSAAAAALTDRPSKPASLGDLQGLERLRVQLVSVQGHIPLSFHWGLYSGDRVLQQVRTRYFRQFGRVLLFDMNAQMVAGLNGLPTRPDPNAPSDLVYRTLKGHLMISSAACGVESPFVSRLLKDMRAQMVPAASPDWQVLADRQIDFYSAELARGNPLKLSEDADAREHARQYLRNAQGIDRLYANILASAENKLGKTTRLSDLASNYTQVLSGPDEMSSAFSREGWAFVEKASKENNTAAPGDACVLGSSSGAVSDWKQNSETAQAVQRLYFHDYIERWRKFVEGFSVTRYSNAGDAARKLDILADHKSPLLAVLAMTANHTNFPVAAEPTDTNVVQKTANKLLAPFKKAETEVKAVVGTPAEASDGLSTPADVTRYFQPVHSVEPPGSETWVVEKNAAYIDALAQLRRSMQDIAQGGNPADLGAVHQAAGQNYEKALEVVRQISKSFKPVGVGGLDATVERLLEEPIRQTSAFIIRDTTKIGTGKINADLRNFCISQSKTLRKYPFQPSSTEDATLDDFSALFDPMRGGIWKFQQQALGEFIVKEGAQWKSKDPAKKPQVTPDLLAFLNRAQSVTDIFFAAGPQPQFSYTFRPKLDSRLKDSTLELDVDGRPFQWTTPLQHQFSWPAPPGSKETGAVARLRSGSALVFAFASRGGIWGVFRILNDAEPREMGAKLVEWRYTTGSAGRREPMSVPVQLEIVGFPAGQDVFHPKFWEGLRCPSVAVQ